MASAWEFYNNFKGGLGRAEFDLSGTNTSYVMKLYTSASNAATATLISAGQVTNEVATGGYVEKAMTVNWSAKTTASTWTWLFNTVVFTAAAGSAIANVKYAVIATQTASILVCWSQLSTVEITVPATTEYHIYPNGSIFELS